MTSTPCPRALCRLRFSTPPWPASHTFLAITVAPVRQAYRCCPPLFMQAMTMIHGELRGKRAQFFVDDRVHPQTLAVVKTRASGLGVEIVTGDYKSFEFTPDVSGCLVQYPVCGLPTQCSACEAHSFRNAPAPTPPPPHGAIAPPRFPCWTFPRRELCSVRAHAPGHRWRRPRLHGVCREGTRGGCQGRLRSRFAESH